MKQHAEPDADDFGGPSDNDADDIEKGDLSPEKARKILHDKKVRGHALTDKQRRFMGARASGQPITKAEQTCSHCGKEFSSPVKVPRCSHCQTDTGTKEMFAKGRAMLAKLGFSKGVEAGHVGERLAPVERKFACGHTSTLMLKPSQHESAKTPSGMPCAACREKSAITKAGEKPKAPVSPLGLGERKGPRTTPNPFNKARAAGRAILKGLAVAATMMGMARAGRGSGAPAACKQCKAPLQTQQHAQEHYRSVHGMSDVQAGAHASEHFAKSTDFPVGLATAAYKMGVSLAPIKMVGEGSRGGVVIGHTKSGKAVYAGNGEAISALGYAEGFTPEEHADAADLHNREQGRHQAILTGLLRTMAEKNQHYHQGPPALAHHGQKVRLHNFYSMIHSLSGRPHVMSAAETHTMGMAKAAHVLTVKSEDCPHCWVMLKAAQFGLFGGREEVKEPGSRGGKGYHDKQGHWQYGQRPIEGAPAAAAPKPAEKPTQDDRGAYGNDYSKKPCLGGKGSHDYGKWHEDLPEFEGKTHERRCKNCGAKEWRDASAAQKPAGHTGTPDDHTFVPVSNQTGCKQCGYAKGHHPTEAPKAAAVGQSRIEDRDKQLAGLDHDALQKRIGELKTQTAGASGEEKNRLNAELSTHQHEASKRALKDWQTPEAKKPEHEGRGVSSLSPLAERKLADQEKKLSAGSEQAQTAAHAAAYGNSPGWVRRGEGKSERARFFRSGKNVEAIAGRLAQVHGQWSAGEHEQAAKLHESSSKFHREAAADRDRDSSAALGQGKGDLARAHKVAGDARRKVADLHDMHARAHRALGGPVGSEQAAPVATDKPERKFSDVIQKVLDKQKKRHEDNQAAMREARERSGQKAGPISLSALVEPKKP